MVPTFRGVVPRLHEFDTGGETERGSGQFGATELRTVGAYTTPDPWGTLTVANHKHGLAIVAGRNGGRGGREGECSENTRFPFFCLFLFSTDFVKGYPSTEPALLVCVGCLSL